MTGKTTGGITIGQAAAFAGVTVKTVRHYHQHGLLDEPRRDSSGYRRYGSADLLRLLQVRTLAAAGVPLLKPTTDPPHLTHAAGGKPAIEHVFVSIKWTIDRVKAVGGRRRLRHAREAR